MKSILIGFAIFIFLPAYAMAYSVTITDPIDNTPVWNGRTEIYSITIDTDPALSISILTNQPQFYGTSYADVADLILDRSGNGVGWDYAIPLVPHGNFDAGQVYNISSLSRGGFPTRDGDWVPYRIALGSSVTGWSGEWAWESVGKNPNWEIIYSDADWSWSVFGQESVRIFWAGARCANDTIDGVIPPNQVPEPATTLLMGSGLVGLVALRRKFKKWTISRRVE